MTHPYSPPPNEDQPQGFSYAPGNIAPVTGAPYPEGTGFVTPAPRPRRPGPVTAAVVLLWVLAGLTTLFALVLGLLVTLTAIQPVTTSTDGQTALVTPQSAIVVGILAVLLLLAFAGLMTASAIRLPKRADSARVLALTLMGFFTFANLSYIVLAAGGLSGGAATAGRNLIGIFMSLLVAAMPAVVIVLLSLKKSVTWFYDKSTDIRLPEGPNMTSMRMVTQDILGDPEVLRLDTAPRPEPGPTEILVEVRAAALNPVDAKMRRGGGFLGTPPFTLGWDVSGVVASVGPGVRRFDVGDEVLGMPGFPRRAGAYADYVTGNSRQFARKPVALSHVEAAGLSLAGLTAWQALVDIGGIRNGHKVLVHAAAGGVGHFAVQIAAAHGAHVVGTASAAKHGFVTGLGAAEVIDYTTTDFTDVLSDMDIIVDAVGGDYGPRSLEVLKPGGVFVPLPSPHDPKLVEVAAARGIDARQLLVEPDRADLEALTGLVAAGKLRVHVDRTFDLSDVVEAHRILESGRTRGKLVLTVSD